ncbi:MAG: metal-dependent hydrolase [Desulfobacterales bacterium]|nr:metal-dependent hydrolase [Desulfobacterales bacterium]
MPTSSATAVSLYSLFFAFIVGVFVATLFFGDDGALSPKWFLLRLYFSILTASHGILDAMTNGGFGVALLSPFDRTRYFSPWTPIDVAPLSLRAFFSHWGMKKVMWGEILLVGIPSAIVFVFGRLLHGGKV